MQIGLGDTISTSLTQDSNSIVLGEKGESDANNFKPDSPELEEGDYLTRLASYAHKLYWFSEQGYVPHYFQMLFHTMSWREKVVRFRHLVAGRRGGKTLAAAWETLYYAMHPQQFHLDIHGKEDDRPLHIWVLTPNYPLGRTAWRTFEECMRASGLQLGTDYRRNLGDKFIEFTNGTLVEFKTAEDPQSLRSAGLDILWIDEAAIIPNEDAWQVVRPALSDRLGVTITTTTPKGKNWLYDLFWAPEAIADCNHGRVEYWSLQNPYFTKEEWEYLKATYHPLMFKQELQASFDSMAGVELPGDWLHYYEWDDLPRDPDTKKLKLNLFMGVDPAISMSATADRFAMALVGVSNAGQVYLIEQYAGKIPFPEQVAKIINWYSEWHDKGLNVIGVESNAFQAALEQMVSTIGPTAPIIPIMSKGKKHERILRMSPLFRIGKVKIRRDHRDFIQEWIDYDSENKHVKDDCLDAVEMALSTAGSLLPILPSKEYDPNKPLSDLNEMARRMAPGGDLSTSRKPFDPILGDDW